MTYVLFSGLDRKRQAERGTSVLITTGRLCLCRHRLLDQSITVPKNVRLAFHNVHRKRYTSELATIFLRIIAHSAHEFLPTLSCFAVLGCHPCISYRIISFEKMPMVYLGITRQFCDLTNSVLQRQSILHLSNLISILNDRCSSLPPSAHFSAHPPILANQQDIQATFSGKICRLSFPCLSMCVLLYQPSSQAMTVCFNAL